MTMRMYLTPVDRTLKNGRHFLILNFKNWSAKIYIYVCTLFNNHNAAIITLFFFGFQVSRHPAHSLIPWRGLCSV